MFWNDLKKRGSPGFIFCFLRVRKYTKLLSSLLLLIISASCASISAPKVETVDIDLFPPYISAGNVDIFPASVDVDIPDAAILEINDEIKALIDEKVRKARSPQDRLMLVTEFLVGRILYDTAGDIYGVKTAQETFDSGTGNCLSFSNLFVAAARYSGLDSKFSEIPTLPNWTRDGRILFVTRHIGASVDIRNVFTQIIQLENNNERARLVTWDNSLKYYFSPSELSPDGLNANPFNYRSVSDQRAFAQYYNNLGTKYMAEEKNEDAFRYFVKAIKTEPGLGFAWSNLGALYRKNNQPEAAEKAYFQGLGVSAGKNDTTVLTIMNNLANLYVITGQNEKAAVYQEKVGSFREKNPYYKFEKGKSAFNNKDFDKSIGLFREAIRLKDDEHLFYYNLALSYFERGDLKKARININNAIKYSWSENRKNYYKKVYNLFAEDNNR